VDYVIIEYKFDKSTQGKPIDGKQMSDAWLLGEKTGYDRILESVEGDKMMSNDIKLALDNGRVEKWIVRTKPDGGTQIKVLDAAGNFKNVDTSKILIGKK